MCKNDFGEFKKKWLNSWIFTNFKVVSHELSIDGYVLSVGATARRTAASASQPPAAVVNVDDDDDDDERIRQQVLDCLVNDFLNVTDSDDRQTARQYLTSNQMDLQAAVNSYFEDRPFV